MTPATPPLRSTLVAKLALATCAIACAAPRRPPRLADGAPCDPATDQWECSADAASVLACVGRAWRRKGACMGPSGCVSGARSVKCDDLVAAAGAPCATEGSAACTKDGAALLACKGGAMVEASRCRGPAGCGVLAGKPTCDATLAEAGDACGDDDHPACSVDGKTVLRCRDHAMTETQKCAGGCALQGYQILCR